MKIKVRLCLTFGIILILVLVTTVVYSINSFQNNSFNDNNIILSSNSNLKQKILDEKMNTYFNTLEMAAKEIKISENNEFDLEANLATMANLVKQTSPIEAHFALRDGKTYTHTRRGIIPNFSAREKKREWFIAIFDNGVKRLMTKPYYSSKKILVMAIGVPIYNNGTLVGSLCINLDVERITKFINSLSDNKNFFVTNDTGFIFASHDKEDIGENLFKLLPEFEKHNTKKSAEFDFNWKERNNEKYKVFSSKLHILDWTFWQYASFNSITKDGNIYLTNTLIFSIIAMLIAMIATYLTAIYISNPLNRTAQILANFTENGDTDIHVDDQLLTRKDEVGGMATALNNMITIMHEKALTAHQIAQGNLTVNATVLSKKDHLGNAFAQMIHDLNQILGQVHDSISQVATGVGEINTSTQSLSQGATEQASSLEEITSSMTQLASQTKLNAESAEQSFKVTEATAGVATEGQERMIELSTAMSQINDNAVETQKVIKTIDDIAFQTNLLALNAAVEAARAGVHGKGFAVVAEEVRNLAARSAKAAAETADLIQHSNDQVNAGVKISEQTQTALSAISENINKSTTTAQEIATSSNEQATGIDQINIGLKQIESVTMQNTANAEETASASEEMSRQAQILKELITHFKLKNSHAQISTTRSPIDNNSIPSTPAQISPRDQILLDDSEFGKF